MRLVRRKTNLSTDLHGFNPTSEPRGKPAGYPTGSTSSSSAKPSKSLSSERTASPDAVPVEPAAVAEAAPKRTLPCPALPHTGISMDTKLIGLMADAITRNLEAPAAAIKGYRHEGITCQQSARMRQSADCYPILLANELLQLHSQFILLITRRAEAENLMVLRCALCRPVAGEHGAARCSRRLFRYARVGESVDWIRPKAAFRVYLTCRMFTDHFMTPRPRPSPHCQAWAPPRTRRCPRPHSQHRYHHRPGSPPSGESARPSARPVPPSARASRPAAPAGSWPERTASPRSPPAAT